MICARVLMNNYFQIQEFVKQMCAGMTVLRKHLIVHRDLKPSTILVEQMGDKINFKIADMGLTKLFFDENEGISLWIKNTS